MRNLLLASFLLLLSASPLNAAVATWQSNSGGTEDGFNVYRAVKGGTFSVIGSTATNVLTFTDNTVVAGTVYCYKVTAFVNIPGAVAPDPTVKESGFSNTDCLPPAAPKKAQAN
jgi:fibronectin type 3 domain-containing protein